MEEFVASHTEKGDVKCEDPTLVVPSSLPDGLHVEYHRGMTTFSLNISREVMLWTAIVIAATTICIVIWRERQTLASATLALPLVSAGVLSI